MDPFGAFKNIQKQGWAHFAPLEFGTTPAAARLVRFARVGAGQLVLDACCGTGVVAVTAARRGAHVTGVDFTPELLARAHENSRIAKVDVDWQDGDVEALPLPDHTFDVVLSQFGHMFAPRPELAIREMLRVLRPGGTIAFSTWPPEQYTGRQFAVVARYMPPPPGVATPVEWGSVETIRERLGTAVSDIAFDRDVLRSPALSPHHVRELAERTSGPVITMVKSLLTGDPQRLEAFRREFEAIAGEYLEDNVLRHNYLLTRATKV
jgi:ubiquinone/menaquinone biosynthesis C-methylase UbiE